MFVLTTAPKFRFGTFRFRFSIKAYPRSSDQFNCYMSKSGAPTTISLGDLTLVLAEENALLSLDSTESPPWLMAGSCDTSYV